MFYYSLTSMKTLPVKRRDDKEVWGSEGPSESNFSLFVREGDSPWDSRISAYKLMWGWRGDPSNEADAATPVKKGSVMLEQKPERGCLRATEASLGLRAQGRRPIHRQLAPRRRNG